MHELSRTTSAPVIAVHPFLPWHIWYPVASDQVLMVACPVALVPLPVPLPVRLVVVPVPLVDKLITVVSGIAGTAVTG
jgi:hypothetical protein